MAVTSSGANNTALDRHNANRALMPPAALICSERVGSLGPSSMRTSALAMLPYTWPPGEKKQAWSPLLDPASQLLVSCCAASALAWNLGIAAVAMRFDLGVRRGFSASGFFGAAGAAPSVGSASR